jgi:hypothetical protein
MSMQAFQSKLASTNATSERKVQLLAKLTTLRLKDLTAFSGQYVWSVWPA